MQEATTIVNKLMVCRAGAYRVPLRAAVGGDGRTVGRRRHALHALDARLLAAADDGGGCDDPGMSHDLV